MKSALAGRPISVAVDATSSAWNLYKGGIFNSTACGYTLDHAVMVVGWGSASGVEYWMVRNSWSTSWCERGYRRI